MDRAPAWLLGLAALVVVCLVGGAVYLVTSDHGPDYPKEWDARVAPLVSFVELHRGLTYDHPVKVNFLTPAEYTKATRSGDDGGPSKEEKEEMEESISVMRALGLVEGTFDFEKASQQLADSGTLAYYDPTVKQVYVRGTKLTPSLRVTLVHELTHVAQDQAFDLERVGDSDGPEGTALRAIAEGDATRIEDLYVEKGLSDSERKEHEKQSSADTKSADKDLADVPPVLTVLFAAPYYFGPAVVALADAQDGNTAVDKLFEAPPSEFSLFDPLTFPPQDNPASDQEKIDIDLPKGAEKIDSSSFGPVAWYLLLASRVGEDQAFTAVQGISSDGFLSYRKDGKVCVSGAAGGKPSEVKELRSALESWAAKGPSGAAKVSGSAARVDVVSCDPGKDAAAGGKVSQDMLLLPARRTYTFVTIFKAGIEQGLTDKQATCSGKGVLDLFTLDQIADPEFMPSAEQQRAITQVAASCR
ncbi:MAG: hypothetical protein KDB02_00155 [Acidimicrobiales bacterium]|nr:hypothetical protein [Acidimicrobiales bacterium]